MRALSVLVFLGALLSSAVASAQTSDMERLIYNLSNSEDFRVRTQAALALGASKVERAVPPLCGALADLNTTVRAASAAALGRLALHTGQECLEKRLGTEASDVVKETIKKALEVIKNGGGGEPVFASDSKFYISIGKTTDKTGRGTPEVEGIVRSAMTAKVGQTPGCVAAPASETQAEAKKRLAAHPKVKGFYLSPVITAEYKDDSLKVKIDLAMATYPDRNVFGNFSFFLKEGGVSPGSTQDENDLIRTVAERAVEKFAGIAANQ
jgi:HEAT repeats